MKVIAIEEHFVTPMYREKVGANEYRNFYLSSRGETMGHDIMAENMDLGASRLRHMDEQGVDMQVLSFGSPGCQGFGADVAIPMAKDANDRLYRAVRNIRRASPASRRCRRRIRRPRWTSSSAA